MGNQPQPQEGNQPQVFVMSASEPILAKPELGRIAVSTKKTDPIPTIIQKQATAEVASKSNKSTTTKPDHKNTPYPVLVPVPIRPNDARTAQGGAIGSTQKEPTPPTAIAPAPIQSTAPPTPSLLKDKQSSECSNSAFLGKVLCEERSRVNFCSNRWNVHPDCQVNNSKLEP